MGSSALIRCSAVESYLRLTRWIGTFETARYGFLLSSTLNASRTTLSWRLPKVCSAIGGMRIRRRV